MGAEMRRTLWLYRRLLGAQIRATLQYEADFWLLIIASALTHVVGVIFLDAVLTRIPNLQGWTLWDIVLIYAMVSIGEGFTAMFFDGMWHLARMINQGDLDYMLVRPYPVAGQVMGAAVGFHGVGSLAIGGILLVMAFGRSSITWTWPTALLGILLLVSSLLIRLAIGFASNAASFWIAGPFSVAAYAVHQIGDLARYPITIFSWGIRITIGLAVPFAFASALPIAFLLDRGDFAWLGLLSPLVALYCGIMACWIFKKGLRRYEGAGN